MIGGMRLGLGCEMRCMMCVDRGLGLISLSRISVFDDACNTPCQ